jgi:hypothetical protein
LPRESFLSEYRNLYHTFAGRYLVYREDMMLHGA